PARASGSMWPWPTCWRRGPAPSDRMRPAPTRTRAVCPATARSRLPTGATSCSACSPSRTSGRPCATCCSSASCATSTSLTAWPASGSCRAPWRTPSPDGRATTWCVRCRPPTYRWHPCWTATRCSLSTTSALAASPPPTRGPTRPWATRCSSSTTPRVGPPPRRASTSTGARASGPGPNRLVKVSLMAARRKKQGGDFGPRMADAYTSKGASIVLGKALLGDTVYPDATVRVPTAMCNRHGLIAGATGTGKTKTLQLMAEQLSALGVPVFAADIKGDLSGLMRPGEKSDAVTTRVDQLKIDWTPSGHPVTFLSLGGIGPGVPVRAAVSAFGPALLAKVLGANETQSSSLSLVFRYADEKGLGLLDLADLRAVLQYLTSDEGEQELKGIGGLAASTAGVLLRDIIQLED